MSSPTYNDNIPQPNDPISQSQPPILVNFNQLNQLFGVDHVKYDNSNQSQRGRHLKVTFSAPLVSDPNLASPLASLYTKSVAGASQLFFQNGPNPSDAFQLTATGGGVNWRGGSGSGLVVANVAQNGYIDFPNGLQHRWGRATGLSNGSVVNFGQPFSNACFSITITGQRGNNDIRSLWVGSPPSTTAFQIFTSIGGVDIWYFAVGN